MNLTPRQIQEKQFHDAFRGYSHEEVDSFLDAVAEAFDHVFRENQSLHHRLKEMEVELTQAKGSEDMLKRTLVTAQETADKAVQEARTKGQSIEQQAASHSEAVIAEAEKKAQKIVVAAVAKERETQDAIEGAKRFDREYRARLRAFIESQLRVLDEGPAPAPSGASPAQAPSADFEGSAAPGAPKSHELEAATPPAPREAVIRLPQEASALVAPGEPDPGKEEDRSIDELFWGEE